MFGSVFSATGAVIRARFNAADAIRITAEIFNRGPWARGAQKIANSSYAILLCGTIQDTPHHGDEVALSAITALITIIIVGDEVCATIQLF